MKSAIYISSEKIEVIGFAKSGSGVKILDYIDARLPDDTMINGKIYEPALVAECLTSLKERKPALFTDPSLMVDGSSILSKKITVPRLSKTQYEQLVRDEFAESAENFEGLVSGYFMMDSSGQQRSLFAVASDKGQVESYISTCKDAGITLKSIKIGVMAILNYVNITPELKNKTFVINVIDGVTMLSMVFNNGANVYQSRMRLYGDERTELLQNMLGNLSGLQQFARSEKFNDIEYSYYIGLNEDDLALIIDINPYPEITLEALDVASSIVSGAELLPPNASFAYLHTLLDSNTIDLIRSIKDLEKFKKRQRPKKIWIPIVASIAVALSLPIIYLSQQINLINEEIEVLQGWFESEYVTSLSAELDAIETETNNLNRIINASAQKDEANHAKVTISRATLDLITDSAENNGVTISSIAFSEGGRNIRLSLSCSEQREASSYVNALKQSHLVASVIYTGYSSSGSGSFGFSLDVGLAGGVAE